jgi:FMN phosphatase YigB (HAD superfamily)
MLRALVFDAYGTLFDVHSVQARTGFFAQRRVAKHAILSNGSPDMLDLLAAQSGLALDAVLSVDEVKLYKPAPVVYDLAVKQFDEQEIGSTQRTDRIRPGTRWAPNPSASPSTGSTARARRSTGWVSSPITS